MFNLIEANDDIQQIKLPLLGVDYLALNLARILDRINKLKAEHISLGYVPLSMFAAASNSEFTDFINDITTDVELRVRFYLESVFKLDYKQVKHRYVCKIVFPNCWLLIVAKLLSE